MNDRRQWEMLSAPRITRRAALVGAYRLGIGAAALALVGCGDDDDGQGAAQAPPDGQAAPSTIPDGGAVPSKITIFTQAIPQNDSLYMALHQGFFEEEGLEVDLVAFSSGTTATESFRTGEGDLMTSGDLPAINNWFTLEGEMKVIAALERDALTYWGVARSEIQTAQDLVGKKIGTRVGSTGSYFIDTYLKENGVEPAQVEVINLEVETLVPALDGGDIDAFFIWEPHATRAEEVSGDNVHRLTSAEGYITGYSVLNVRTSFLEQYPAAVQRILRATIKGAEFAEANRDEVITFFQQPEFAVDPSYSAAVLDVSERPVALDEKFYEDFCQEFRWAQSAGVLGPDDSLPLSEWADRSAMIEVDSARAPDALDTCPA